MLEILTGTGCDRHRAAVTRYAAHLKTARAAGRLGTGLWISPSARTHKVTFRALLEQLDGRLAAPNLHTFESFSEAILVAGGQPAVAITPSIQRLLMAHAIETVLRKGLCEGFSAVIHTQGFQKIVGDWIAELKRDETWPDEFLEASHRQRGGAGAKDKALAAIYAEYQDLLARRDWYDQEGRSWLARAAVAAGAKRPFEHIDFVILDGFVDFTWIQYELIEQFARWDADILITLPDEETAQNGTPHERAELFTLPRRTRQILLDRLSPLTKTRVLPIDSAANGASRSSGIAQITRQLFRNPRWVTPAPDAAGLEVIAAGGPHRELEIVSHQLKQWRLAGIPSEEIVVIVRSLSTDGQRWVDHLELAGVPVSTSQAVPLGTLPIVRWLRQLVELERDDWPLENLRQIISSSFFRPATVPPAMRRAMLQQLARFNISGKAALAHRFRDTPETTPIEPADSQAQRSLLAAQGLETILRQTEKLASRHSFEGWIDLWTALVGQWSPFTEDAPNDKSDRADWELLQRVLRSAAHGRATWVKPQHLQTLGEWWNEVEMCLAVERSLPPASDPARIRLMDPAQARLLDSIRCVVIVGATEQAYPASERSNCLYSHSERQNLIDAGLPLVREEDRTSEEMLLFWQLASLPREQLLITYSAMNAKGQELFGSPFVMAVCGLFSTDLKLPRHVGSLDVLPEPERCHTRRDLRLAAMQQATTGRAGWWKTGLADTIDAGAYLNMARGLPLLQARFRTPGFTEYEGMLTEPALQAHFREKFGPDHQFSVTRLETYANCPFRFWIEEVLGLAPREQTQLGTNFLLRGTALHGALATLLGSGKLALADEAELGRIFAEHVAEELRRRATGSQLGQAMARLEARIVGAWSQQFAAAQRTYLETLIRDWGGLPDTTLPEVAFGMVYDDNGELIQGPYPALEIVRDQQVVRLGGKIDRIDAHHLESGERYFSIIDYKSGGASRYRFDETAVQQGLSLQLAVYLLAVKRLRIAGDLADAWQAGFWGLRKEGLVAGLKAGRKSKEWTQLDESAIATLEDVVQQSVIELAEGIRRGEFMVDGAAKLKTPPCTSQCPAATVCRVKQQAGIARVLKKIRPQFDVAASPRPSPEASTTPPKEGS